MQEPDFYCRGIFKLSQSWDNCIGMLGECVKNSDISVKYISNIQYFNDFSFIVMTRRTVPTERPS